jgi:hypothetical protein
VGGALGRRELAPRLARGVLRPWVAWRWDEEAIQLLAWLSLVGTTIWFALGMFDPSLRAW